MHNAFVYANTLHVRSAICMAYRRIDIQTRGASCCRPAGVISVPSMKGDDAQNPAGAVLGPASRLTHWMVVCRCLRRAGTLNTKAGENGYKTSALVAKEVLRVERVQDAKKTSSSVMSLGDVFFVRVRVLCG